MAFRKTSEYTGSFFRRSAACLLFALALLILSLPVHAAGGTTDGLQWQLSGGTLTISGSGAMPEYTDANMPPWSEVSHSISRIVVDEGVTGIGALAFYNCDTVKSVSLPATVTSIGDRAFKFCRKLSYLKLPTGLLRIGEAAFEYCEALNGIILPDGLQYIGDYAFDRCTSLSHITIPVSVTELGRVAFHCCTGLTQIVIESPIEKLPDCIFYGCSALSSIALPETVTLVGVDAFHGCTNLGGVYYSGTDADVLQTAIQEEPTVRDASVREGESISSGSGNIYVAGTSGVSTAISDTENATITKTLVSTYDYTINGEPATLDEVLAADETDEITATGTTDLTVNAVIHSSDGWDEVKRAITSPSSTTTGAVTEIVGSEDTNETDSEEKSLTVKTVIDPGMTDVRVQLETPAVTARELAKLAGEDVTLTISTPSGSSWIVDASQQTRSSFKQPSYDLDFTVTKLTDEDKQRPAIESETTYALSFQGTTDFDATVGVPLKVGEARKVATLYQKDGRDYESIQSVVVDDTGTAWFPLANVDSKTEYYVAVNAAGVDRSEAIIPATMAKEYNLESTLMGLDGKQYRITGRSSRWGITGTQFAIYAAIGIGLMVLIVTLIMVTRNRIMRSKAKYAAGAAAEDIDEEALRMEIMRELLGEKDDKDP